MHIMQLGREKGRKAKISEGKKVMSTANNCLLSSKKIQEQRKGKEGEKVINRWK